MTTIPSNRYCENLIYDKANSFTEEPFLKEVFVYNNGILKNTGEVSIFVWGKVTNGGYISTFYLKGCGFQTSLEEVAFAIALEEKLTPGLGKINVKFLS